MTAGAIKLLIFGTGLFALLFPKSPLTIRMFRNFGPRTDFDALLKPELKENTRQLLGLANICLVAFMVLLLLMPDRRLSDDEMKQWGLILVFPGAFGALLLFSGLVSAGKHLCRRPARDDDLIRQRLAQHDVPRELEGKDLRAWLQQSGLQIPGPPVSQVSASVAKSLENLDIACLALGGFLLLAALGLGALAVVEWERQRNSAALLLVSGLILIVSIGLMAAGIRINKLRKKPRADD